MTTLLLQGCIPTMARAVVVNAAQLASYSQSKQALLDSGAQHTHALTHAHGLSVTHTLHQYVCVFSGYFRDDILCHFCASMISGLVTTAASMPVDIVKTRWDWRRLNSSSVVQPSLTTFSFLLAGSRTWRWSTGSQSIKMVWWVANFICFYLFLLLHFGH